MEMPWWEIELDHWFRAYLPRDSAEELPGGLLWSPFNVDLASEHTMCAGLKDGLQNVIETAGCHDLEVRPIYRHPDNACSSATQTTRISAGLGIYSNLRLYPDAEASAASPVEPPESLHGCYDSMEIPVEVQYETMDHPTASSAGTPTTNTCPSPPASILPESLPRVTSTSEGDCTISESSSEARPWERCGQLTDNVVELFNRQHRLFVFAILFVNERARLVRFDRAGASMTPEFDYAQRPELIGKFLRRLSRSRDAMGHDPTATPADEAATALFRTLHAQYHPESIVGRCLKVAADGWPVYRLTIKGGFSSDEKRAVRRDAPISRREVLIGKPMSVSRSLFGRGTKAHVAYDVATRKVMVIKDSWRPNSGDIRTDYDTYLLLNDSSGRVAVTDIPTLLGGGDVAYQGVTQETRTSNPNLRTRIHFRLVLKEVCRPLEDFVDSLELVTTISFALGAHYSAWTAAHVLHRDVSVGNILIFDQNPEEPPDPKTSKGLLSDWDLAITKDELNTDPVFPHKTRAGTWPFMSARLQHSGPEQRHELSDDLESFVHVLNYCTLKYLSNKLSNDDVRIAKFISDVYHHVRCESGGLAKGSYDKLELLVNNKPFVELRVSDHPLSTLLRMLSELCSQHYHHIQFPPPPNPSFRLVVVENQKD
ncbi:hypothetical protein V8D89_011069 [Ganoderma adspersum]